MLRVQLRGNPPSRQLTKVTALEGGLAPMRRERRAPLTVSHERSRRRCVFYLSTDELRPLTRVRGDGHMRDMQRA